MKITFLPYHISQDAEPGETLLSVAARANILLEASCGGHAVCGKCKLQILSGDPGPLDPKEKLLLSDTELENGIRLACHVRVYENLQVGILQRESAASRKSKVVELPTDFAPLPYVRKRHIFVEASTMQNQKGDLERVSEACGQRLTIHTSLLQNLPELLKAESLGITVTINEQGGIIALEPGDTANRCYGIAFDIGTTTVVAMLWNLATGTLEGVHAVSNPQGIYGADVISRISYAGESEEDLKQIHHKIIDCLNDLILFFEEKLEIQREWIYDVSVVGNTTMSHLFLGVDPSSLAQSPYAPVFCQAMNQNAKELGINVSPLADLHLLPNIAGHVGSDITAGVLSTRIQELQGLQLFIDVGTNGEIVLAKQGRTLTASTAAGPAFEGARISQGMRAASGAIENVRIEADQIFVKTINDLDAVGICGSGLIDAVAQMRKSGVLEQSGKLLDEKTALERGIPSTIAARLQTTEQGKVFVLSEGEAGETVSITQKDIRELQLAKGAIYTGIMILLGKMGATPEDITQITIAGAFGNYIDKENAMNIGLFPSIPPERILFAGNTAGIGASMALLSTTERLKSSTVADSMEHVELSIQKEFQSIYMASMYLSNNSAI